MDAWIIWLIVVIILAFIELITVNLVTIWFVISGICALILSIFVDNLFLQLFVFTIFGIILLVTTKPIFDKYLKVDNDDNLDAIIGRETILLSETGKNKNGLVKIDGREWTVFSDEDIEKGKMVKVICIKGVRIKVKELI